MENEILTQVMATTGPLGSLLIFGFMAARSWADERGREIGRLAARVDQLADELTPRVDELDHRLDRIEHTLAAWEDDDASTD